MSISIFSYIINKIPQAVTTALCEVYWLRLFIEKHGTSKGRTSGVLTHNNNNNG